MMLPIGLLRAVLIFTATTRHEQHSSELSRSSECVVEGKKCCVIGRSVCWRLRNASSESEDGRIICPDLQAPVDHSGYFVVGVPVRGILTLAQTPLPPPPPYVAHRLQVLERIMSGKTFTAEEVALVSASDSRPCQGGWCLIGI